MLNKKLQKIEFLAPAGAGKTTLVKYLEKETPYWTQEYCGVLSTSVILAKILRFFSRLNPKVIKRILNIFSNRNLLTKEYYNNERILLNVLNEVSTKDFDFQSSLSRIFYFLRSYSEFFATDDLEESGSILFDEGPAQRLTSLIYLGCSEDVITNYIENAPLPDILFVINVTNELLKTRIANRNGQSNSFFKKADVAILHVLNAAKLYEKRGCKVIFLDGALSLEENAILVNKTISSIQNQRHKK